MSGRPPLAPLKGETTSIRSGDSTYNVRIATTRDGLYVAQWKQRSAQHETGPCTSIVAAKMCARMMMRKISGVQP